MPSLLNDCTSAPPSSLLSQTTASFWGKKKVTSGTTHIFKAEQPPGWNDSKFITSWHTTATINLFYPFCAQVNNGHHCAINSVHGLHSCCSSIWENPPLRIHYKLGRFHSMISTMWFSLRRKKISQDKKTYGEVAAKTLKCPEVCNISQCHASKCLKRQERKLHLIKNYFSQWAALHTAFDSNLPQHCMYLSLHCHRNSSLQVP